MRPDCSANCARCDHTQRDPGRFRNPIPASIEAGTGIDAPGASTTSENGTASAFAPAIVCHAAWKSAISTALERRFAVAAGAVGASRSWRFSPVMSA